MRPDRLYLKSGRGPVRPLLRPAKAQSALNNFPASSGRVRIVPRCPRIGTDGPSPARNRRARSAIGSVPLRPLMSVPVWAWVSKGLISFPRTSSAARIAARLNVASRSARAASTRPSPPGRAGPSARRLPAPAAPARRRGESVSVEAASPVALRRVRRGATGGSTQLSAPRRLESNRVSVTDHLEANPLVEPGRGEVGHLRSDHQGTCHLHPRGAQASALCLSAKGSHRCLPVLACARFRCG